MTWLRSIAIGSIVAMVVVGAWAHWPETALPEGSRASEVVVRKAARRLELYHDSQLLKSYPIALGRHPTGAKEREGDGRTPEGIYWLDYRNAHSAFHRALHISYPAPSEFIAARARSADPGGLVMIHGIQNGLGWLGRLHRVIDWTDGCMAVTDPEMDEIWRVVPDGTRIELRP